MFFVEGDGFVELFFQRRVCSSHTRQWNAAAHLPETHREGKAADSRQQTTEENNRSVATATTGAKRLKGGVNTDMKSLHTVESAENRRKPRMRVAARCRRIHSNKAGLYGAAAGVQGTILPF